MYDWKVHLIKQECCNIITTFKIGDMDFVTWVNREQNHQFFGFQTFET
jgi:hypothetical protein